MIRWLFLGLVATAPIFSEIKVVAFSGSSREGSYNKKLIAEAVDIAKEMGASVTFIDLKDYPMPFYDADLEKTEGMPESAQKLRKLMIESDAIIIASPEYNHSIPAVLKNALDWASRTETGEFSYDAFKGKQFALMSASPGKKGGEKGLVHLRDIIEDLKGDVVPLQVCVGKAYEANLKDPSIALPLKEEIGVIFKKKEMTEVKKG